MSHHGSADRAWVDQAVADFGRSIGLDGWRLDSQGEAGIQMDSGVRLSIALLADEVLLQAACPLLFEPAGMKLRALQAADVRHGGPMQVGLRGRDTEETLLLGLRIAWREASPAALAQGFEKLLQWLEQLRRGRS